MTWERYGNEQRAEGRAEGERIGEERGRLETARNFLDMGLSVEQIAKGTELDISVVEQLKAELQGKTSQTQM